ncbi:DMT family transporter [Rhodococcus aerolatus]
MLAGLLGLLAALGYGVSDFVGGVAARKVAALRVVVVSYPFSVVLVAALLPFVGGRVTVGSLVWGGLAGVVAGVAVWSFYVALGAGPMSVVSPLTSVLVVALPVAAGIALGERPSALALVGAVVAVVAVALVSREPGTVAGEQKPFTRHVALLTVVSGVAFAGYFVLLDRVESGTGLGPLLVSRVTASLVVLAALARSSDRAVVRGRVLALALLAGVLDVVANVAFLYALQAGYLSLVSVVTALYPAATVLLATVVLGERTGRVQVVGMGLAAAAVALIASQG